MQLPVPRGTRDHVTFRIHRALYDRTGRCRVTRDPPVELVMREPVDALLPTAMLPGYRAEVDAQSCTRPGQIGSRRVFEVGIPWNRAVGPSPYHYPRFAVAAGQDWRTDRTLEEADSCVTPATQDHYLQGVCGLFEDTAAGPSKETQRLGARRHRVESVPMT